MMIIAHRAGKALGPENTIGTMQAAEQAGAHGFEVDVRCSMDDIPMLMHDATIDRTTNGSGEVFQLNASAIEGLDAGEGRAVPPLHKVLDTFLNGEMMFFIELKHPATALPTANLIDHFINQKSMSKNRIVVVSCYHQLLALIKDKYPKMITGAMVKKIPESQAACGEYTGSNYILPPIDDVDQRFMDDANRRDLMVVPWVVDTPSQLDRARKFNVNGIITSDPRMAK